MLEGRYIIIKTIGQGGMGAVYLALDTRLKNMPVAIKEMSTKAVGGDLQGAIDSFQKEAQLLINLRHPALPIIYDFFSREENRWYLVMDYIKGDNLKAELQKRGPIPEAEVGNWAMQLCDILDFLHKRNPPVIFRDLKPDNIMLTPEGQIKLIDFGIARNFQPGSTADTTAYGSGGFAPPEQYGINQTDPRSDIYALGATLHFLITGIDPSKGPFRFEPPSQYVNVSINLEKAIMQALELKAEDRPQNIEAFKAIISQPIIEKTALQESVSPTNDSSPTEIIASTWNEADTVPLNIYQNQSVPVPAAVMNDKPQNQSIAGNTVHQSNPDVSNMKSNGTNRRYLFAGAMIVAVMLLIGGGAFWLHKARYEQANTSEQISNNQAIMQQAQSSDTADLSNSMDKNNQSSKQDQTMNQNKNSKVIVQTNLEELNKGEQIANQYDSLRVNLIKMLNNLAAGQGSIDDFYNTCSSATTDRQALLSDAQSLRYHSNNPEIHKDLINMLNYSLEYCTVCRQGADAVKRSDDNGLNKALSQAQSLSEKIQASLDAYTDVIKQERNRLKSDT
ncbi:MAG TPA: serine/threonine protein kinase [Syntrophomonadaceae bacterium]|nr:serine/threonine protein kinase [Syntrophomonadaceae bacterium]